MFWFHIFILFTVQIWKLSLFDSFLEHEYSNAGAAEGLNSYLSRQYPDICKIENNKELTGTSRMFNEPEPIKEILTKHVTNKMRGVETRCLKFLENHDPKFVEEWRAQKETTNTENEESS